MDSSPPSTPRSSGVTTPLAYDENFTSSTPSSPEDVNSSLEVVGDEEEHLASPYSILGDGANAEEEHTPKQSLSKLLKGKEKEWAAVARKGPLRLLDLPVDILREIIHQVSMNSSAH